MKNYILTGILALATVALQAQDFVQGPFQDSPADTYAVGDFDGDGYEDIFGINIKFSGTSDLFLFKNDSGSGSLSFQKELLAEDHPGKGNPDAADYDGDGDLDVVLATGDNLSLVVFENDGSGAFIEVALGVGGSRQLKFGDIDGDGDMDIAGIDIPTKTLNIFINDGNQNFSKTNLVTSDNDLYAFAMDDIDGDGDLDIVAGYDESNGDQVILMENNGNNSFGSVVLASGSDLFKDLNALAIGDLNQDGNLDIAGACRFNFSGLINDGNLNFQEQSLAVFSGTSIFGFINLALADFDGDEVPDAVMGDNDGPIAWYKNTSTNPLEYEKRTVGNVTPSYVFETVDFDQDGDIDIVTSNGEFWWYENVLEQVSAIRLSETVNIDFFPNPVQNTLTFNQVPAGQYRYEILDVYGKVILSGILEDTSIDLTSTPSGNYFLTLEDMKSGLRGSASIVKI